MALKTLPGTMKAFWFTGGTVPGTIAAPTAAELAAAIDLIGASGSEEMVNWDGWVKNSSIIQTPGMASHNVGNVPGDESYPASALLFYKDDTVETIYSAMIEKADGYVGLAYDGDSTGDLIEMFQCTIQSRVRLPDRGSAHIYRTNFAIQAMTPGAIAA